MKCPTGGQTSYINACRLAGISFSGVVSGIATSFASSKPVNVGQRTDVRSIYTYDGWAVADNSSFWIDLYQLQVRGARVASNNRPLLGPDMNRYFSRRRMRSTAFMVLLAWLFAVASGVANACLLEAPHHDHVSAAGASMADLPAHLASHAGDIAAHSDDVHTSSAPCQKVCDDTPQSLPKALSGLDQTNPGLAPPIVLLWSATAPIVVGPRRTAAPG